MPYTVESISLEDARKMLAAGEAVATSMGIAYNIAVVDTGGHLVAFSRQDGALLGSVDFAIDKATTSRLFDKSTAQIAEFAQSGRPLFGIQESNAGKVVIFGGGIPVKMAGRVVGAVAQVRAQLTRISPSHIRRSPHMHQNRANGHIPVPARYVIRVSKHLKFEQLAPLTDAGLTPYRGLAEFYPECFEMTQPLAKITAILTARPGKGDELRSLLVGMAPHCRAEPGNLRWDVWCDQTTPERYILDELYRNEDAMEAHRATPHYQDYLTRIPSLAERSAFVLEPVAVS